MYALELLSKILVSLSEVTVLIFSINKISLDIISNLDLNRNLVFPLVLILPSFLK